MKRGLLMAVAGVVVLGIVIAAIGGAQVYPTRWLEEPPPLALAALPNGVVLGNGAIALNPDVTLDDAIFGGQGSGRKIDDGSCASSNRGEIRIMVLCDDCSPPPPTATASQYDALCFCQRSIASGAAANYWWSCFKVQ